jgi:phosphate/sulfate permease
VATVIYTHSLPAQVAVVWSGVWNFLGVMSSTGLVAFTIISLLPVELILQVGSAAGFAMVFALLIAAIIWNVSTWYFGIPNSSSHALIGSIIGVGLGASAEVVAMATIAAADMWGWPVSTTHVLSSGVAGTMAANRSGLQWSTLRNMIMAWVLTLPAAIMLSGALFWMFRHTF